MLLVLHGTDTDRTRAKMHALVADLQKRKPDAEYFRVEAEGATPEQLDGLAGGQGLFEQKYIVVLDNVCTDAERTTYIKDRAEHMAASDNVFIVLERSLAAGIKKVLTTHAQKVEEHNVREKKQEFNVFVLADAIGKRDKRQAWIVFQQARAHAVEMQNMHGVVAWQVKNMILAHTSGSAQEAGMKAYPYKKAQTFCKNYTLEELHELSRCLVDMLHESRKSKDLGVALERFVLSL